jgi:hypothetical protein
MCSQTDRGRLENRIFGNGIRPEDCPYQIFPRFAFAFGICLRHKPAISCLETIARRNFGLDSALRKHDQRPALREMPLPGQTLDFDRQLRRNGDALAYGGCRWSTRLRLAFHVLMLSSAPACRSLLAPHHVRSSHSTRNPNGSAIHGRDLHSAVLLFFEPYFTVANHDALIVCEEAGWRLLFNGLPDGRSQKRIVALHEFRVTPDEMAPFIAVHSERLVEKRCDPLPIARLHGGL